MEPSLYCGARFYKCDLQMQTFEDAAGVEKLDVFADTASIGVEIERSNPKS